MIQRLRERPGKLLPMLVFAAVAALCWWLGLLAIGVAEILLDSMDSVVEPGISETLDAATYWIALAGLLVVPIATLAWSRAIAAQGRATAAGVFTAFAAYLIFVVPIFLLWVFIYESITGDLWNW